MYIMWHDHDMQRTYVYYVTSRCFRVIIVVEKVINIAYSEYVFVASVIQNAKRMRHVTLSGPLMFYSTFIHYIKNSTIFGKMPLNIKCVF
jgi:hypothetical protein